MVRMKGGIRIDDFLLFFLLFILFFSSFLFHSVDLQIVPDSVDAVVCTNAVETSRHQAIVDFLVELQMVEGGFLDNLMEPRSAATLKVSKWAAIALQGLNSLSAINQAALTSFVVDCQEPDGGFTTNPWETVADYETVAAAVEIMIRLGALGSIDQDTTTNWVMACYRSSDGGFNDKPSGYSSLMWPLQDNIATLNRLGRLGRINSVLTNQYAMGYYDSDGGFAGFSLTHDGTRSLSGSLGGVSVLYYLGSLGLISVNNIVNYLMSLYDSDTGSFLGQLTYTVAAVLTLEMLGRLNQVNSTLTTEFVLSCQTPLHGGFVNIPEDINNPVRERLSCCYQAVEILRVLGTLDALEESFIIQESPVWTGDDTPPTTYTPPTPPIPPLGPEFWAGVALVAVAVGVFAVVVFYGFTRTGTRRKKVKKKTRRKHRRT